MHEATEALNKIKAHIIEEPRRIWMSEYYKMNVATSISICQGYENGSLLRSSKCGSISSDLVPPCNTVGCIAGWSSLLKLGLIDLLTEDEKNILYYVHNWPSTFCDQYLNAKTPLERATVTCARIDHFIATDGKE